MVRVRGEDRKCKYQRSQEEDWMNTPITFPPIPADDVSDEPLIIVAEVEGYPVLRVFVDQSAAVQVMFEHCFDNLPPSVKARLTQTHTELVRFFGEQLIPMGKIELSVMFESEGLPRRTMMKFTVLEEKQMIPERRLDEEVLKSKKEPVEEEVLVNPAFLEPRVTIGTQLSPACRLQMINLFVETKREGGLNSLQVN
ncbi:hypothetical protein Tco_0670403 [Tanacetum coccineum]